MSQSPANADPSLEEQLVAYLDGELDTEASRRVEELLASDPKVRQTLQELDRTWELLDQLETPQVAESFTQSTLEMVAVAAAEDTERSRSEASRRRRRWWVIASGSLLAAAAAGFLTVALQPDPNQQLIDDLPVLENLDEYRRIDDIRFLQALHDQRVFAEEAQPPQPKEEDREELLRWMKEFAADPQRQDEIFKAMPEKDKPLVARIKQLQRDHTRFKDWTRAEQDRLRQLHTQLEDAPELRLVMQAFGKWLKSLSAYDREELLEMKTAERITRIQELRAEEAKRPKPEDLEGLSRWIQQYAAKPEHREEIFKAMPEERRPFMTEVMEKMKQKPAASTFIATWAIRMQMYRPVKPDWLTDDELAELRKHLSEDTRKRLESESAAEQWKIVSGWMRSPGGPALFGRRFRGGPPPKEFQDQLDHFFEHELTPEEQSELLHLPPDELQRELQRRYIRKIFPMPGPGFGPRRPGPPGPPRNHSGRPGRGPRGEAPGRKGPPRDS